MSMQTNVRILIADDDPSTRELLAESLFVEGYEVEVAPTGELALERVMQSHPDVVILDRMLPGKSGDEILASIREMPSCRDMAVFILSGISSASDRAMLLRAGADDYITKPFAPKELSARVGAFLRRSQGPLLSAFNQGEIEDMRDGMATAKRICDKIQIPPPEIPGFSIVAVHKPAGQVGGDFIEYLFQPHADAIIIANGDVSGHGLSAALSMIMTRTLLRNYALEKVSFQQIMSKLHAFLRVEALPGHLASLALFEIGPLPRQDALRKWRLTLAGHPQPFLKRDGVTRVITNNGGTYLGVPEDMSFPIARGSFHSGDRFLIYSDGLLEALSKGDIKGAQERVRTIMNASRDARELTMSLEELLPDELTDDVSFIALDAD